MSGAAPWQVFNGGGMQAMTIYASKKRLFGFPLPMWDFIIKGRKPL